MGRILPTVFLALLACSACQQMPASTRNGDIRDILISDKFSTAVVEINVGEEIRWTNNHVGPVRIVFMDTISERISCRRNFCGYFTGGAEAFLKPNQNASLCFRDAGTIRYFVMMQSVSMKEHVSRQGLIQIESPVKDPAVRQETTTP